MSMFNIKVHNHFDIELIDSETGKVKQRCTAYNKVLNNLYNKWSTVAGIYTNYFSQIFVTSNTTPMSDDDTTVPSPRWSMSSNLTNGTYDGTTQSLVKTGTNTFPETLANADLTAVALSQEYTNTFTYAQFTDSEGNPIVITKTSVDRLTITVTVYITLNYDYAHMPVQLLPYSYYYATQYITQNGDLSKLCPALLTHMGINWSRYNSYAYLSTISNFIGIASDDNPGPSYLGYISSSASYSRFTTSQVLSTSCNANITYQIKGIVMFMFSINQSSSWQSWGRPTEFISLPNHAIYPPKQITLNATGDGTTVDFNLGVPHLMTTNVEVSIDGVLQPSSSYIFNGKDYTFYQAWESGDSLYMTKVDTPNTASSYVYLTPLPCLSKSESTYYRNFYYDFKAPITVSKLQGRANYSKNDQVWYSNDNENWTQITQWVSSSSSLTLDPPIQARYWKILNAGSNNAGDIRGSGEVSTAFGDPKPQLHFNTAPPADSVITVKAYTEYPIKNSNWIIEPMTVDYTISHN